MPGPRHRRGSAVPAWTAAADAPGRNPSPDPSPSGLAAVLRVTVPSRGALRRVVIRRAAFPLLAAATVAATACDLARADDPAPTSPDEVPSLRERATFDRPDEAPGSLVHVVYAACSDCEDRGVDSTGAIEWSLERIQDFLEAETGLAIRWDVFDGGADVTFLRLRRSREEIASLGLSAVGAFIDALERAGLDEDDKKYLVVYEGHSPETCGAARQDGPVAIAFVGLSPTCPDVFAPEWYGDMRNMEYNMLHELLHALGFVDPAAPNHVEADPHHVGDDPRDIMYSGPKRWTPEAIDPGGDDYLGLRVPEGVRQLWESPYLVGAVSGGARPRGRWPVARLPGAL